MILNCVKSMGNITTPLETHIFWINFEEYIERNNVSLNTALSFDYNNYVIFLILKWGE